MHRPDRWRFAPLRTRLPLAVLVLGFGLACSDDDGNDPGPPAGGLAVQRATPSGNTQTGVVGEDLADPLRVLVTRDGAPEAGHLVEWGAMDGSIAPDEVMTGADGIAAATWTLGTAAGAQGAQATLAGASGSPLGFSATATAGPAAELSSVSGGGQAGRVGTAASAPLIVRVGDAFGNAVSGTDVGFAVTAGSGTVGTPNATTGANGQAQTGLTFGATAGPVTVQAASAGLTGSPQTFAAQSGHVVVINDQFNMSATTVPAGTTVRWVWGSGAVGHNITPVGGAEPAGTPGASNSAPFVHEHTFNTPGVYSYECTNHVGMTGTITVQ